ncbi:MAG: hypothetical protein RLZZ232_244, partial [Planctomycetota bacterium]
NRDSNVASLVPEAVVRFEAPERFMLMQSMVLPRGSFLPLAVSVAVTLSTPLQICLRRIL